MLLPKVIRTQYRDSILYYLELLKKIKFKLSSSRYKLAVSIDNLNVEYTLLSSIIDRKSSLNSQTLINNDGSISYLEELEGPTLDINLYYFKKISILGGTDALLNNDTLYHEELLSMDEHHDLKRHDLFLAFDKKRKEKVYLNPVSIKSLEDRDKLYISLLKEHSVNYYHWMTEIMPRAIFCNIKLQEEKVVSINDKKIVFLVDESLPSQCLEVLENLISFDFSIEVVLKNELIQCRDLIYCSSFWQSLDNTSGTLNVSEFFVDKYALNLLHTKINEKFIYKKEPYRKIYLKRSKSQIRSIVNNEYVESEMKKVGYELVDTSSLSFLEQVKLFSEAKVIVGASGATFTNILFMQPGTTAINFYPSHPSINHGIFQPLADISGVKLLHYKTHPIDDKSIHSNFFVDLNIIKNILKDIDK